LNIKYIEKDGFIVMKKFTKIITTALILSLTPVTSFAQEGSNPFGTLNPIHENQTVIYFEAPQRVMGRNILSDRDIVAERLEIMGFSQNFLNTLPESSIEILVNLEKIFITDFFHEEYFDGDDVYLSEISRDDFLQRSNLTGDDLIDGYVSYVRVQDDYNSDDYHIDIIPNNRNWVENNVGGGTLWTRLAIGTPTNSQAHYIAISEFVWTNMPTHRGTDFLGLTRGVGYSIVPNTFISFTEHTRRRHSYHALLSGVFRTYLGTDTILNTNHTNQIDLSQGVAISINVPVDVLPPHTMVQGTNFMSTLNWGLSGGVAYQGRLTQQSPWQQNLNHFMTYLHQRSSITWGSPQLSVSFPAGISASISVSPANSYTTISRSILSEWIWR